MTVDGERGSWQGAVDDVGRMGFVLVAVVEELELPVLLFSARLCGL